MALQEESNAENHVAVEDVAGLVVVETSNPTDSDFDQLVNPPCFNSSSTDDEAEHQIYMLRGDERIVMQADVPVGTPSDNFIPEDYLSPLRNLPDCVTRPTIQILKKRHRDRLRKRELRLNVAYKEKDRAGARCRMKKRRKDPVYRSIEREKDRIRRQKARHQLKLAD